MPIHRLFSAAFIGLEALLVEVEVDLTREKNTLLRIIGLPDAAIKESKDRVLHAIKNSGFLSDEVSVTVHLAPAEIKKTGAFYDLPIALGLLRGMNIFTSHAFEEYLIGGELGLAGEIRPIVGALALSLLAKKMGKKGVIIPKENASEAAMLSGIEIIPLQHLKEGVEFFKSGQRPLYVPSRFEFKPTYGPFDVSAIKGQAHAKRALEIAAAGKHNVLMSGPPGTGKTMLAKAFIGILPPLKLEEALDITNIYSLAGHHKGIVTSRPFRSPHHTISCVGLIGGGSFPKPGEISLAHHGVLFLDELPEFARSTLEVLRQPLEDKVITVSRSGGKVSFPTDVICLAAMNPCPCGFLGHKDKPCVDTQAQINRYRQKISGPLLDRFDIHLEIPPVPYTDMVNATQDDSSETIRARVEKARERLASVPLPKLAHLKPACQTVMKEAIDLMNISARSHARVLRVARTIAALDSQEEIDEPHLLEALSYLAK